MADDFKPLRPEFMAAPFWFWNDELDPVEVKRQVVEMYRQNIGGFFMHARMGRVTPYMSREWMDAIKAGIEEAARHNMGAWIYDEDGWPSGYGGGIINNLGKEYLQQYALAEIQPRSNGTPISLDPEQEVLAVFDARKQGDAYAPVKRLPKDSYAGNAISTEALEGDHVVIFRREYYNHRRHFSPECWADGYVDVLNGKVIRAFIRKIYETYRKEVGDAFGTIVPGFFTDEPNYHDHEWIESIPRLTISPTLEKEFAKRYGEPLADHLMTIIYGGPDHLRVRWCYYSALAHLFANNFTRLLAQWCEKHNLIFTGHYLLEESPRAATQVVGDVMQHYAHQHYPGIDHLGKPLDLDNFWSSARVLVKQAASVAHQLDKPRVMCETYAGGGWDFGPVEQKWMGDWQYALGLNLCCQHAFHYSLRGFRKRDYPPSLGFQQPWYAMSADLGSHFARLGYALTRGRRVVRVLVLHPIESFFATHEVLDPPWPDDPMHDAFKQIVRTLVDHQVDFDFGNEVIMKSHARIDDGKFVIGSGTYDVVIVPPSVTWRKSTISLLRKFVSDGGRVATVAPRPTHVDAKPSDGYDKLFAKAETLGDWNDAEFPSKLLAFVRATAPPDLHLEGDAPVNREIVCMQRHHDGREIFFLTSARTEPHTATAVVRALGMPMHLETTTGELTPMPHMRDGDTCRVQLEFDIGRSHVIVFEPDAVESLPPSEPEETIRLCDASDAVTYHLNQDNALLLDRCELLIDGESQGIMFPLEAQLLLAEREEGIPATLRYTFTSARPVPKACLLLETPEQFEVTLNGREVPVSPSGDWFVDPGLRRAALAGGLDAGENVLNVNFTWQNGLELEPLYVLGRFGVYVDGDACRIDALPGVLNLGSWHDQGLAFYAGSVTYTFSATLDNPEGRRWYIHCPAYRNTARVRVNGIDAGVMMWSPHRVEVTELLHRGRNRIEVEVANSLRNFLGPHHIRNEDEIECLGPSDFFKKENRVPEYRFKPAGLLGPVELRHHES